MSESAFHTCRYFMYMFYGLRIKLNFFMNRDLLRMNVHVLGYLISMFIFWFDKHTYKYATFGYMQPGGGHNPNF